MKNKQTITSNDESEDCKVQEQQKHSWIGLIFAVLYAVCASLGALLIKMTEGGKLQINVLYCFLLYLVIWPYLVYKNISVCGDRKKHTLLLVMRGAFGAIATSCNTLSLNYLSLGDSQAIIYTFPMLVGILACVCLNEKCSILNVIFTLLTFVGLVLVAQPSFIFGGSDDQLSASSRTLGVILSFTCTTFSSFTCITLRKLGQSVHFSQVVFYLAIETCIVSIIYLALANQLYIPCIKDLPVMAGAAAFLAIGQMFLTLALQHAKAGPVALLLSMQVVFAFILQYLAFGMIPSLYSAIGAGLIFACSVGVSLKGMYKLKIQT